MASVMTSRYRVPVLLLQSLVAVSLRFGWHGVLGSRSLCHCADLINLEFQAVRRRHHQQLSQVIRSSLVVGVVSRPVSSWWRRRVLLSLAVGSSSSRLRRHHLAVEVQRQRWREVGWKRVVKK